MNYRLILLGLALCQSPGIGQGTIFFANRAEGVDAIILDINAEPAAGSFYAAQLYAGPEGADISSLQPFGELRLFYPGEMAGYFREGSVTIEGVPPGQVTLLQVRCWDLRYVTFEDAYAAIQEGALFGCSQPFLSQPLGGGGYPVPNLVGLETFVIDSWCIIPEPSFLALAAVGIGCVLLLRHRRPLR